MIYIHAENLGLLDHLVNTNFAETSAKNYSWSIRLSTKDTSSDKGTTVVEMPQDMALPLFWWYCNKEASEQLTTHLCDLLDNDEMKKAIVIQLEWSVTQLDKARNIKVGRPFFGYDANMAYEIEDHVEYEYENKLYALLDAKGFEKEVEA
jgi:hypothetical protein